MKIAAPSEIIRSDICGYMEAESLVGSLYNTFLFEDDFFHYRTVFLNLKVKFYLY